MLGEERWEEVHRRAAAGASIRAIARELDLDRKMVRRCLRQSAWRPYQRAAVTRTRFETPQGPHRNPLCFGPIWPKMDKALAGSRMKTLSAKDAKYGFGRLIDLARAEPVAVAKHGRPVMVVMAVEEYERLKVLDLGHVDSRPSAEGTT